MKTNRYILRKRFDFAQYKYAIILAMAVSAALSMASCTKEPPEEEEVIHVTGITLNPTAAFLLVGKTLYLEADVEPAEIANQSVTWSTSDDRVATVNPAGEVTAVAPGTATITVTTDDGRFTAECSVTVAVPNITMTTRASVMGLSIQITADDDNFVNFTIDWGDGKESKITDAEIYYGEFIFRHNYSDNSIHRIAIAGENILRLGCSNNLTALDVSGATALTYLDCDANQLTALDLSCATELTYLSCCYNQLTSLDVSRNTALTDLYCYGNSLTSLDVSKNTALNILFCLENKLTSLDVSGATALEHLYCYENRLTNLDVSRNTALISLICNNNQLTSLDVGINTALRSLDCSANILTNLDVSRNKALNYLVCFFNSLTDLDVSKNIALTELYCHFNKLTTLDVSGAIALRYLYCWKNQLTDLDVSGATALDTLFCEYNQLTASALNELFKTLPYNRGEICIDNNPGTQDCDRSIAEEKGWWVL